MHSVSIAATSPDQLHQALCRHFRRRPSIYPAFEGIEIAEPTCRYVEAKALVFASNRPSFRYLRRVLGITHAEALAYLDRMEREEFISLPDASGTRKVLARDLVGGQA